MRAEQAARLFDANAARYDRVNAVVSLGLERRWRRWVAKRAVAKPGARVLDAFAGTGAIGLLAARLGGDVTLADTSERMLAVARRQVELLGLPVRFACTDLTAPELPFAPASFDAITAVFAVRYLDTPTETLAHLGTLLRPKGQLIVMEFVEPGRGLLHWGAGEYFFRVLPRIASAIAGSSELYDYLADSTQRLGHAEDLDAIVTATGLRLAEAKTMGFGLIRAVVAVKDD